jgi:molybdate transport system substrate-binding protein
MGSPRLSDVTHTLLSRNAFFFVLYSEEYIAHHRGPRKSLYPMNLRIKRSRFAGRRRDLGFSLQSGRRPMDWKMLLLALAAVCGGSPAHGEELLVSAPMSVSNAFRDIGSQFERNQPGSKVVLTFAASEVLLRQIVEGAPADVFASADHETMDRAQRNNAIDTTSRRDFAGNELVVALPIDSKVTIAALEDLAQSSVRQIAMGQPAIVPVGRYAKAALQKRKLWSVLLDKLIYTQNVRQSLDYLARGEVDAGFLYATDVPIARDKVKIAVKVLTPEPIRYPIAVTKQSRHATLARQFVAWVTSPTGQAILQRYGFIKP